MADNFVSYDRETLFLMPPSMQEWLPPEHLARFVVELVTQLDLRVLRESYAGRGSAAYHPEMLVALLFYGYATGVRSSYKIAAATYDSVAFRYIAANKHPDQDTIATFRRRFLPYLDAIFNEILRLAKELKCLEIGRVSLDGTKIKASASKHRALSLKGADRIEAHLRREVKRMLELAEEADQADEAAGRPDFQLPAELARREDRLKAIAEAKARIREREAERQTQEQADHDEALADRKRIEQKTGKKMKSRPPERPKKGVRPDAQLNLTDAESRIMPSHEGFIQGYNAQAAVDTDSMLIVGAELSQRPTDRRLIKPMLRKLSALPIGKVSEVIADAGYFSELNVELCVESGITPYIVAKRNRHHWGLRHWKIPKAPGPRASALTKMLHRLRTPEGRAIYALRKHTVEPVFGILKQVLGFRQFLLRGFRKARGEYLLGCSAWNIRRLHTMVTA
jgi:transposase